MVSNNSIQTASNHVDETIESILVHMIVDYHKSILFERIKTVKRAFSNSATTNYDDKHDVDCEVPIHF